MPNGIHKHTYGHTLLLNIQRKSSKNYIARERLTFLKQRYGHLINFAALAELVIAKQYPDRRLPRSWVDNHRAKLRMLATMHTLCGTFDHLLEGTPAHEYTSKAK